MDMMHSVQLHGGLLLLRTIIQKRESLFLVSFLKVVGWEVRVWGGGYIIYNYSDWVMFERNAHQQSAVAAVCVAYGQCVYVQLLTMKMASLYIYVHFPPPLFSPSPPLSYGATFLDGTGTDQIMAAISD